MYMLNIVRSLQKFSLTVTGSKITPVLAKATLPLPPHGPGPLLATSKRNVNFFNKLPAQDLWKGITSVSNAGRKRGRGKRVSKRNIKDLNRGQMLGIGKQNIVWPGLSAPVIRGRELVERQQLPEDAERQAKLNQLRDQMGNVRRPKISALDRGWTGAKMPGRSIGPPDPIGEENFDGFDSRVLQHKLVFCMTGTLGRTRRTASFVITGNGKGLAGFAMGKSADSKTALKKAKNRASQKLMHFKIFRGHTVFHDFYTRFGNSKVFVCPKPEGHGLVCHRAIKTVCQIIGIKDLYAKVEGSTNVQNVVKAFILGLLRQKPHEQIVEEKRLHLVELRKENGYFPTVLASPADCRKRDDIKHDEVLDFKQHCLDGRVVLRKKKFPRFYTADKSWQLHLKKVEKTRGHDETRVRLLARYGELRSFLTETHPEARHMHEAKKPVEE